MGKVAWDSKFKNYQQEIMIWRFGPVCCFNLDGKYPDTHMPRLPTRCWPRTRKISRAEESANKRLWNFFVEFSCKRHFLQGQPSGCILKPQSTSLYTLCVCVTHVFIIYHNILIIYISRYMRAQAWIFISAWNGLSLFFLPQDSRGRKRRRTARNKKKAWWSSWKTQPDHNWNKDKKTELHQRHLNSTHLN